MNIQMPRFLRNRKPPAPPRLTGEQVRFLEQVAYLTKDERGAFFTEWLEGEKAKMVSLYEEAADLPTLRLLQGRSAALNDLLSTAKNAPARLDAESAAATEAQKRK